MRVGWRSGRCWREGHLLVDQVMAGVRKRRDKDADERQKAAFRVNQSAAPVGIYAIARYIWRLEKQPL
jgi:hypothetical protein